MTHMYILQAAGGVGMGAGQEVRAQCAHVLPCPTRNEIDGYWSLVIGY